MFERLGEGAEGAVNKKEEKSKSRRAALLCSYIYTPSVAKQVGPTTASRPDTSPTHYISLCKSLLTNRTAIMSSPVPCVGGGMQGTRMAVRW